MCSCRALLLCLLLEVCGIDRSAFRGLYVRAIPVPSIKPSNNLKHVGPGGVSIGATLPLFQYGPKYIYSRGN